MICIVFIVQGKIDWRKCGTVMGFRLICLHLEKTFVIPLPSSVIKQKLFTIAIYAA